MGRATREARQEEGTAWSRGPSTLRQAQAEAPLRKPGRFAGPAPTPRPGSSLQHPKSILLMGHLVSFFNLQRKVLLEKQAEGDGSKAGIWAPEVHSQVCPTDKVSEWGVRGVCVWGIGVEVTCMWLYVLRGMCVCGGCGSTFVHVGLPVCLAMHWPTCVSLFMRVCVCLFCVKSRD